MYCYLFSQDWDWIPLTYFPFIIKGWTPVVLFSNGIIFWDYGGFVQESVVLYQDKEGKGTTKTFLYNLPLMGFVQCIVQCEQYPLAILGTVISRFVFGVFTPSPPPLILPPCPLLTIVDWISRVKLSSDTPGRSSLVIYADK